MWTRRPDSPPRKGYHHGNLKEALVAAARDLVAEVGPAGFTINEAARRAGVSAAAPYRHFRDRDALLAAVAREGWSAFRNHLAAAWGDGGPTAAEAFARMGDAYLSFARFEPGYYAAMFAPGLRLEDTPDQVEAPDAFALLGAALNRLIVEMKGQPADEADARFRYQLALKVWGLSHGIAQLTASGILEETAPGIDPRSLLRDGVAALICSCPDR
jgi:AcrR family transcriptional regulator